MIYLSRSMFRLGAVKMIFIFLFGFLFALLCCGSPVRRAAAFLPLSFKPDGTFQISIFEDLHFGENAWDSWGPQQDLATVKVLQDVLTAESPDLVVLNGDLITGENGFLDNSTHYVDQLVEPLVARGLPWASTYGNHDHQFNLSGHDLLQREKQWPNALTQSMVDDENAGVTNYVLPVYGQKECNEETCKPEMLLWFFDSRGGIIFQQKDAQGQFVRQPSWVDTSVVSWFRQTNAYYVDKHGGTIPSIGFTHIPADVFRALQAQGVDQSHQPGINVDAPLSQQASGWCADGTSSSSCQYGGQDVPFMEAVATTPGFIALFSGHDHGDTWCYRWEGVLPGMTVAGNGANLCFGQHGGYGGYGNLIRGSRQVVVSREKLQRLELETRIRLETCDVVGAVTLNSTYGKDVYTATPNDQTHCPTCMY